MKAIDEKYLSLGCLGHGGFGSVFLAEKISSGKRVAMKFFRTGLNNPAEDGSCRRNSSRRGRGSNSVSDTLDNDDGDDDDDDLLYGYSAFSREVDALLKLEDGGGIDTGQEAGDGDGGCRGHRHCVYAKDWFHGHNFACIVMNYFNGGTLAQQIDNKRAAAAGAVGRPLYTERRICWYALQLCSALAHAHSCGVIHFDVKSSNILVDDSQGGRLVLADFGSSVSPGEVGMAFSKEFAPPELLSALARDDYTGLDGEKIDSFGVGCILFELICCKRIIDFGGEETIGELIGRTQNADEPLDLPHVSLPWLQTLEDNPQCHGRPSYSINLRCMIKALLLPTPEARCSPSSIATALRTDANSPIIADYCPSQKLPRQGDPLTIDNLQLGMFVQRGRDWNDGNADGGLGGVGVIVELDEDCEYTWVSFPRQSDPTCYRVGANNKFELSVGPTAITSCDQSASTGFKTRLGGIVPCDNTTRYSIGHMFDDNLMVVHVNTKRRLVLVGPTQKYPLTVQCCPSSSNDQHVNTAPLRNTPRKPNRIPPTWTPELGLLVRIDDGDERRMVQDLFFAPNGGMDRRQSALISIEAIQSKELWDTFVQYSEKVAIHNWSNPNHTRLFFGTRTQDPKLMLQSQQNYDSTIGSLHANLILSSSAAGAGLSSYKVPGHGNVRQIILSRVALGRIRAQSADDEVQRLVHHSKQVAEKRFTANGIHQIYPDYLITYRVIVHARRPQSVSPRNTARARRRSAAPQSLHIMPPESTPHFGRSTSRLVDRVAIADSNVIPDPFRQPTPVRTSPSPALSELPRTPGGTSIKMCVVCIDQPVSYILYPCGHGCLCEGCSSIANLSRMKLKCPECRSKIVRAIKFYGTMVE